jgi:hypothetical protein
VHRRGLLLATPGVALACAFASDLAYRETADAAAGHNLTLRGRSPGWGWTTSMSRRLVRTRIIPFTVCAVWDQPASRPFDCTAAVARLPRGTELRLEQKPAGQGIKRRDSPGWGMVGLSHTAILRVPLSNAVTGNRYGTVRFRVTLRRRDSGAIVYRSNPLVLRWRR